MATLLRGFMSRTDANGLTGRGKMFVLSRAQLLALVPQLREVPAPDAAAAAAESAPGTSWLPVALGGGAAPGSGLNPASPLQLLDIGSGDGGITERYSSLFRRVVTTETSAVMARRLRARGWECFEPPAQEPPLEPFDLITCLNVLDRCDKPLSLLRDLRLRLRPDSGRLLLAVVLPWCPFVESGTEQKPPSELLDGMKGACCRDGASFEKSLHALVDNVVQQAGFDVLSVSRVPYISEGDQMKPYYVLWDSIIVCKRRELPDPL
jgi:hypothetical protein